MSITQLRVINKYVSLYMFRTLEFNSFNYLTMSAMFGVDKKTGGAR